MLMGPVFRAELLRTARRGRYYVLRLVYAAILLALFWSGYQADVRGFENGLDRRCRAIRRDDIPHLRDRSACHGTGADTATLWRDHRGRETEKDPALLDGQPAHGSRDRRRQNEWLAASTPAGVFLQMDHQAKDRAEF